MQPRPSFHHNALMRALLNVFNLLVPLLVGPYINGLLEPDALGLYYRSLSEAQVFLVVGAFGIYTYGVRELSRLREDRVAFERVYTALFSWGLLTNALACLAYLLFFLTQNPAQEWAVYAALLFQFVGNVFTIEFLNEATENYRFITIKTILIRTAYLLAILAFVRRPQAVVPYALVVSLTILFNQLASFCYVHRRLHFRFRGLSLRPHALPLLISFLLTNAELLYAQADRVLLGLYGRYPGVHVDVTVTLYSLTFTLVGMLASVPVALLTVAVPRLSASLAQADIKAYETTLAQAVRLYLALLLPICAGLAVVAPEAMAIYTRGVYSYASPLLALACLQRVLYGLQFVLCSMILYLFRAEGVMALLLGLGGLINLGFKAVLIAHDQLSPSLAMGTTSLSLILFLLMAGLYIKKKMGLRLPFSQWAIVRYSLLSLSFFPIAWGIRAGVGGTYLPCLVIMAVCASVYGAVLIWTRDPLVARLLPSRFR